MEVVAVVLVLLAVSTMLMVKPNGSWPSRIRLRKKVRAAQPTEEPFKARLQRRLKDKQEHHRTQLSQWDVAYYTQLPLAEHPDFLEPTALDVKGETRIERRPDGTKIGRSSTWWTPDNRAYTIRKTYEPVTFRISRGDYSEDITGKWLRMKDERKAQERLPSSPEHWMADKDSVPKTADLSNVPVEVLSRFYSPAELADPQRLSLDRFEWVPDSTMPGNCIGCGRFKKKLPFGYYVCRDEYFRAGSWRHRF